MDHYTAAKTIVKKFVDEGFIAYFAGGWVRDYVMGHPSYDIDIATDASPEKIMEFFPKTILVGLSFGVVIVVFSGHQYEVSTFRKDISYSDGRRPDRIEMSNAEEDAKRRDFTINGMFYDPLKDKVHDFVGGYQDIQHKMIRTIGDPIERFKEDRLRMIRAIRFACRFDFEIDSETEQAIWENAGTLFPPVAKERVWQEFEKMRKTPLFDKAIIEMFRLGLLTEIFPFLKGVHLKEIRHLVTPFPLLSEKIPTILFLLLLFEDQSLQECLEIAKTLHVRNQDLKWIRFYFRTNEILEKEMDLYSWAEFYADPHHEVCLEVIASKKSEEERNKFFALHASRKEALKEHIERLSKKIPILTAKDLQHEGIVPGIRMGKLLKEAEKISVNKNIQNKFTLMDELKKHSLWI